MAHPTIEVLRDLIAIDSVTPSLVPGGAGERQIAEAMAARLRTIGADVELHDVAPGRPNVIGVIEGRRGGPDLVLCGHLDTVGVTGMDAPFDPVIRDNRVYGRGAQDMKGGLAAIVGAVARLVETGGLDYGRVVVAGVCDEEDASRGAEAFVARWRAGNTPGRTAFAVVTEPTDLGVGIAHKGFAWLHVTTTGRAAHGSRPTEGRDAVLDMGRLLVRLGEVDRARQARPGHPLLGPASLHASFIEGGREWSTYPDRCDLKLERRTLPGEDLDEPLLEISRVLESLVEEDEDFAGSVSVVFARRAYEIPADHVLVERLRRVAAAAGADAAACGLSFWADSAVLGEAGLPTVLFGPGGAGLHGVEEYVRVDDVLVCEDALARLVRALAV